MKLRIAVTMIVLSLMFGGCIPLASDIQNVGNQTLLVSEQIDALQDGVASMAVEFEKNKLISAETADRIKKVSEEIDRIQPTMVDVATAVRDADYVDGDTFGNAIKGLIEANTASAPVNPYAVPIGAGLTALGLIAEMLRRREKTARLTEAAKRQADKQGRELTLREVASMGDSVNPAVVKELMYKNIGNARAHNGVT